MWEIWFSHIGFAEDSGRLGCDTVSQMGASKWLDRTSVTTHRAKGHVTKSWILKADLLGQFKTNRPRIIQSCCIIKSQPDRTVWRKNRCLLWDSCEIWTCGQNAEFLGVIFDGIYIKHWTFQCQTDSLYLLLLHKNNVTNRHVKLVFDYFTSYVSVEIVLSFETSGWDYSVTQLHISECETLVAVYFTQL